MDLFESGESRSYGKAERGAEVVASRVPWARFSSWLECVCVVTFDLELGQAIELVYPHDVKLTEKEKTSICYLSFPDSYSGCLGDTQFSFRVRQSVGQKTSWFRDEDAYNRDAPVTLQRELAHYYGYVYFRQVKDVSVKRGYFQKSLVLVSRLPYVNLFQSLLQLIAPEYFEKLEPCLEAVCNEIDQWPSPVPGQTLNLPVMGVVLQVRIPSRNDKPGASPLKQSYKENLLPAPMVLPTVHELDVFKCFQSILIHSQMLWELMLLGEPVVVMASSPTVSSETVLALISCVSPLKYCCDFRPYFTIHDSEFKEYTTRTQAPPNVILGVTNPFFIKTFQYWPHIIRLGDLKMSGDLPKQVKVKKLAKLKTLDTKPGIYTAYKTFLHKDKALIKRLLKGIQRKRPSEVQSAILRRHFLELTQSFIIPLERYVASLMPLQRAVTPWKNPPQIRSFNQEEFMKTLEHAGPQLTSVLKGDWLGLYRRFFRSPNFDGWYRLRHKEMTQKLECLHLEVICEADLLAWIKDKSEVEIVDLILKLREKLMRAHRQQLPVKEEMLQRLELYIQTIISSLPEDLQAVLRRH
ncbi:protein DENND6B isoform X1 [Lepisosteus oculatus]|uniref:DENN/MADD domain containing 6B n=1 Tax=Lepisosteus oculatus TaxID=7918 RepID=W5NJE1_LEPOC|nr:PREDICTED: protein DENND6B isoform X1 [Lepisosteus oculatus]XP_015208611.1 PREDICTED: protein DENND6B isoform X1 [Lepisosteus oculatus]